MRRIILSAGIVTLFAAVARAESPPAAPQHSSAAAPGAQPTTRPVVDPNADRILHETCDYLARNRTLCVRAEIW